MKKKTIIIGGIVVFLIICRNAGIITPQATLIASIAVLLWIFVDAVIKGMKS